MNLGLVLDFMWILFSVQASAVFKLSNHPTTMMI